MLQNGQRHQPGVAVAGVFFSLICNRQNTLLDATDISQTDVMNNAGWMSGEWFDQKMKLLLQRFEVVRLTIGSLK